MKGFLSRRIWCLLAEALPVNGQVIIFGNHVHRTEESQKHEVTEVPVNLQRTLVLRTSAHKARHKNKVPLINSFDAFRDEGTERGK